MGACGALMAAMVTYARRKHDVLKSLFFLKIYFRLRQTGMVPSNNRTFDSNVKRYYRLYADRC
jgi:hypothetical protein